MERHDIRMASSLGEGSWAETLGHGSADRSPIPLIAGDISTPPRHQAIMSTANGQKARPKGSLTGVFSSMPPGKNLGMRRDSTSPRTPPLRSVFRSPVVRTVASTNTSEDDAFGYRTNSPRSSAANKMIAAEVREEMFRERNVFEQHGAQEMVTLKHMMTQFEKLKHAGIKCEASEEVQLRGSIFRSDVRDVFDEIRNEKGASIGAAYKKDAGSRSGTPDAQNHLMKQVRSHFGSGRNELLEARAGNEQLTYNVKGRSPHCRMSKSDEPSRRRGTSKTLSERPARAPGGHQEQGRRGRTPPRGAEVPAINPNIEATSDPERSARHSRIMFLLFRKFLNFEHGNWRG